MNYFKRALALSITLSMGVSSVSCAPAENIPVIDDNYRNYYEIFVGSYYDSDGDGTGDLKGITEKLGYIKELGANGLWLTPIMPSNTYHKYDVDDYRQIDPSFGTLEDFDELIKEAHARDIRVVIDLVINHTSDTNEWFKSAVTSVKNGDMDGEYVDYYHFSDEDQGGGWYQVSGTDYYYEADFWSEMPDLNLTNEKVISEIYDIADYWIDRGVDGFRMDAALHYEENDNNKNIEVLKGLYDHCLTKNPGFYMVSEVWASGSVIADYYRSETPSFFNFPASSVEGIIEKTARGFADSGQLVNAVKKFQEDYSANNPNFINAWFLTNHDQVRVANNLMSDEDAVKFAGGLLSTMPGAIYVYYGEEIGMKSSGNEDENKRLPFVWSDDTSSAGMCKKVTGASEVEQNFGSLESQKENENSIYNYYKKALKMRLMNPGIARGSFDIEDGFEDDIAVVKRSYEENDIFVIYNSSADDKEINISDTVLSGKNVSSYLTLDGTEIKSEGEKLVMKGRSICVMK